MSDNNVKSITISEGKALLKDEVDRVIADIFEQGGLSLAACQEDVDIEMSVQLNKLVLLIKSQEQQILQKIERSLSPLRKIFKDYTIICENYLSAIKDSDPSKVEAIDMGRRSVHNEGAEILSDMLEEHFEVDFETYRKLFTLIHTIS